MEGDKDSRRSTTRYVFIVGRTIISWISKWQKVVELSTTEVECVVVIDARKVVIWLQIFMDELGKKHENRSLYSDIQSAIHLTKKSVLHSNTKHIQIKYHFI